MTTKTIKRIHPLSLALTTALTYAIIGIPMGLYFGKTVFQSLLALVIFPAIYGVFGFLAGGLTAIIFNIATFYTKGIKIDVE